MSNKNVPRFQKKVNNLCGILPAGKNLFLLAKSRSGIQQKGGKDLIAVFHSQPGQAAAIFIHR